MERSPLDIASDSLQRTDSYSGVSEVLAPQIKAFSSNRTSINGQVQLRTAGPFTDSNNVVHHDGAYLEIILNYVTATPDPEGALYFDQVNWAGGEIADLVDYGATVLDCREDVRDIYRVPIGYTGYGHYGGHYGQYGRRGYGGYGYGRRGHYGRYNDRYGRRGGDRHDSDNDDQRGDRHSDDGVSGDNGQTVHIPTGTRRGGVVRRDLTDDQSRVPVERDPDRSTPRRGDRVLTGGSTIPPSKKQPRRRAPSSTIKADMAQQNRAVRSMPASRPNPPKAAPVSRPAPPPPPPPAKRQTSRPKNTSRATDRAFKKTNNSRTRAREKVNMQMRYDPYSRRYDPGYTDYQVSYSCQRQESLRVFIPRERLLAAEKNGLLLYVKPRNGIEETIALPPNYISGFLLAAYSPDGKRITPSVIPPKSADQVPKPERSAGTPIIYGGE
ncbi:MAG: hypothetical protein HKO02_11845 [Hyphomonadaceae bacterium]|nr:hypothetical protein [Hyphomonadaceae bacterium]